MKNFRKVLALVLVVATLFSFTAMASAKSVSDYKDADKISYDEAVDVLSAVGILDGYPEDGTFKPTNTITREEMAKMIAVLSNAGTDVSTLYASACTFADVAKDRWSASYVAYCAKTGVVAGRSASTFDPTAKVTGLETAKMLLVVLGFNAEKQGYVGSDWKVNVLRDAKTMGLLENFAASYDIEKAITREEAAQMMLNALEAPCVVGVLSNNHITVTNALVFGNVEELGKGEELKNLIDVVGYAKLKDAIKAGKWCLYGNVVISDDLLCERLFNMVKGTGRDCFGRPSTIWTINGKTLVAYPEKPVWTSTNTTVATAEGKSDTDVWYTDGQLNVEPTTDTTAALKGVLVEVYADGTIVAINTYLGTVCQINTARGTFAIKPYFVAENAPSVITGVKNTLGFKPADEGTTILYWICNGTCAGKKATPYVPYVHDVEVVEAKTIEVHGTRFEADYFCSKAEDKYEYDFNYTGALVNGQYVDGKKVSYDELGTTIRVYLDKYGYVLGWADVLPQLNVSVMVAKTAREYNPVHNNYTDTVYTRDAKFVEFESNPKVGDYIGIDEDLFDLDEWGEIIDDTPDYVFNHDRMVVYTTDANGNRYDAGSDDMVEWYTGPLTTVLNKGSGLITAGPAYAEAEVEADDVLFVGNSDTQYLLRVFNHATGKYEYKYFDGKEAIDGTYLLNELQFIRKSYNVHSENVNPYLAYVYAEASFVASSDAAFVYDFYTQESFYTEGGVKTQYWLYKAIVNGEAVYVAYDLLTHEAIQEAIQGGEKVYNKVYVGDYKQIIAETHDGLPIYLCTGGAEKSIGKNFVVEGNTLVWEKGGTLKAADMAPDAVIWAITVVDGKQTVKQLKFSEVVELCQWQGWKNIYGWTYGTPVSTMYIYAEAK